MLSQDLWPGWSVRSAADGARRVPIYDWAMRYDLRHAHWYGKLTKKDVPNFQQHIEVFQPSGSSPADDRFWRAHFRFCPRDISIVNIYKKKLEKNLQWGRMDGRPRKISPVQVFGQKIVARPFFRPKICRPSSFSPIYTPPRLNRIFRLIGIIFPMTPFLGRPWFLYQIWPPKLFFKWRASYHFNASKFKNLRADFCFFNYWWNCLFKTTWQFQFSPKFTAL